METHSARGHVHFAVSFGRNMISVGRESLLEQLLATAPPNVEAEDCQRAAIVGLGGVGKAHIALEVAYRIREKPPRLLHLLGLLPSNS